MDGVPLSLAVVAGALSILNPCGFPLLPAFLAFYVGAEEDTLPSPTNRVAQGLLVGLLAASGFLSVFAVVGLPISLGVRAVAQALPWLAATVGIILVAIGVATLAGRRITIPSVTPRSIGKDRRARSIVLFGVGFGTASLGCTLPLFLTLIAASLGASRGTASLGVFVAYGMGMATVLMALSVTAALFRDGLARRLRRLLPHVPQMTGLMLVVAGAYLTYYWLRFELGPRATLSSDPVVGAVAKFTARVQVLAEGGGGAFAAAAGIVVAVALSTALYHGVRSAQHRHRQGASLER